MTSEDTNNQLGGYERPLVERVAEAIQSCSQSNGGLKPAYRSESMLLAQAALSIIQPELDGANEAATLWCNAHAEVAAERNQIEAARQAGTKELLRALHEIHGGIFQNAGTYASDGNWKYFVDALQEIAGDAINEFASLERSE